MLNFNITGVNGKYKDFNRKDLIITESIRKIFYYLILLLAAKVISNRPGIVGVNGTMPVNNLADVGLYGSASNLP